jgi:O-antigen biosynthesis protein
MVSLITPTHKPQYLRRLYGSLRAQTCKDFEWVIVPNNGADVSFLPKEDWIRIVPYTEESNLIGAVKNFAFHQGRGVWLAEVDHDDELMPNCVEEIVKAASEVVCDFIYSDSVDHMPGGNSNVFNPNGGWVHYPFEYKGATFTINKTFQPTPQSVSRIWYAPNHIRVWKKDLYVKLGGHDKTLKALDDQDLMCRTYINGKMHKIEKVLYVYYYHDNNSFSSQELNAWIQEYTMVLYEKYINQLMEKWCDDNNLLKIDINKRGGRAGYLSVDLDKVSLLDNSVGLIIADDALQLYDKPVELMTKIWKCLAHGGMLLSSTPSTDGRGAFQDPTHVSYWNANSFWYYTKEQFAKFAKLPLRFQSTFTKDWCPSDFHKSVKIEYTVAHLTALKKLDAPAFPGATEI